ncbi:MAG: 16S rRNA (adenine(1518)-N(6)/adenine(1519)-N(6))-dimethyltransferase RsmA [Bacteroidota bacterium]
MYNVKPKKSLGQHFLNDPDIAKRIVDAVPETSGCVLEVGPGMGILTQFLEEKFGEKLHLIEIDGESISFLEKNFSSLRGRTIHGDFLHYSLDKLPSPVTVVGNFPYFISSQILFRIIDLRNQVDCMVGMFQKEMAERIVSEPGNKTYGIPSVLTQAYFSGEYLFSVDEHVFTPPPKVKSGVIRLTNRHIENLNCDPGKFTYIVRTAFNQRRKTLRNALKSLLPIDFDNTDPVLDLRAERLTVQDYIRLTNLIFSQNGKTKENG